MNIEQFISYLPSSSASPPSTGQVEYQHFGDSICIMYEESIDMKSFPIASPPGRWWGGKGASRSNPFGCIGLWGRKHIHKRVTGRAGAEDSRQRGRGRWSCLLREQLPPSWQPWADRLQRICALGRSCRLPLGHCLSYCTSRQVVLMLRARLWWCSNGGYLYWWERYGSNRNGSRQVDPLQQNITFLPLQLLVVPLNKSCLINIKQLQSRALHVLL